MKLKIAEEHNWEMGVKDWFAVIGASLGAFMAILDVQITNASVREIQGSLGLDFSESGWISSAYLIAEIVVIPLTAFFAKVFGMRRYVLFNCAVFIISSVFCGLAWNLHSLICARIFQGLSGGTLIPIAFQTMLLYMPPHRKNLGLALFGMIATLAPTLGPSVGGWLTETYSWRAIFLINIIPGLLMMAAIRYGMPDAKVLLHKLKKIDLGGMLTLTIGLATLTYILEEGARVEWFEDFNIRICFLFCIISLPLFLAIQLLKTNPLLNLNLFKNRNFSVSALITMLSAIALYGGMYALSLYLGQIQNYSAQNIGQVMMWLGIPQLIIMPLIPFLLRKVDPRILSAIGLALFAFSNYLNAHLNSDYSGDQFIFSLIIRAIGQPLFVIPLSSIGMSSITPSEAGNASSIYNVLRNLGGSIGIALTGTFAIARENLHFGQHVERMSALDTTVLDRLKGMQMYLISMGADLNESKGLSLRMLMGLTHRESLIEAFSDVFAVLCYGLFVCLLLLYVLNRAKTGDSHNSFH